jgi:hypothetical protein
VATTIERGPGFNHSLCHGDLGNLETVLLASRAQPTASLGEHLKRLSAMILGSMRAQAGAPLGIQTPGLMTGLADIGYQCLRLAAPIHVGRHPAMAKPGGGRSLGALDPVPASLLLQVLAHCACRGQGRFPTHCTEDTSSKPSLTPDLSTSDARHVGWFE